MFLATQRLVSPDFSEGAKIRVSSKVLSDYRGAVRPRIPPMVNALQLDGLKGIDGPKMLTGGVAPLLLMDGRGTSAVGETPPSSTSQSTQGLTSLAQPNSQSDSMYNDIRGAVESVASALSQRAAPVGVAHGESSDEFRRVQEIAALAQSQSRTVALRRAPPKVPRPAWHPPWKLFRVISGSLGWVRSLAIEPGNQWFASGAGDRTIKIWDLASGKLKLTLTGHIETVRGLCISPRNPYMYSVGEDKMVKCWDLETNKAIRTYDGHQMAVYACALHPTLDVLLTGSRDSTCRVWDIRTRTCVHVLSGHEDAVSSVLTNSADPQVITGGMDSTVRTWDLAAGKVRSVLTHHKKSVRALVGHAREFAFVSAAADGLKKWALPQCSLVGNFTGGGGIVNSLSLNADGVLVAGGDNGSLRFWDYATGYCFQEEQSRPQSGSLDAEAGIYSSCFDLTGSRLITGEADKTIKIWKEDDSATPESHPIDMDSWTEKVREFKRL